MGRNRKISKDEILDAAARVVVKLGATGLSIDAVAQEAGVSKATVVYDHKSKSALLDALIEREIKAEVERIDASVQAHGDTPHPELFGRIAALEQPISESDRAIATTISASMADDDKLRLHMQELTTADLQAMASGPKPRAALLAYLALTGFYCTELFGFHTFPEAERREILEAIRAIYTIFPE
ncbi:TetR/AcrR family transcriptional regulator [Rhizobium oryzicola]|uniref:TetR/AcrR family transcriptional regulator n=1 Tax=Rhizobium oryzicola TaxID=1232668 RepID=A0ABT8T2E1_9HYPH|nr:TetR/AcrR family transcriptional regulator [Rhizobium oryzicola]MDO1584895.1 TetR/AcrR family transcriptional regulator [Rhizobium oryzicola]